MIKMPLSTLFFGITFSNNSENLIMRAFQNLSAAAAAACSSMQLPAVVSDVRHSCTNSCSRVARLLDLSSRAIATCETKALPENSSTNRRAQ